MSKEVTCKFYELSKIVILSVLIYKSKPPQILNIWTKKTKRVKWGSFHSLY